MKFKWRYFKGVFGKYSTYSHGQLMKTSDSGKRLFFYIMWYKKRSKNKDDIHIDIDRPCIGGSALYCSFRHIKFFDRNSPLAILFSEVV